MPKLQKPRLESPQVRDWRCKKLLLCDVVFSTLLLCLTALAALIIGDTHRQFTEFTDGSNWTLETASVIRVKDHRTRSGWVIDVLMRTKSGKLAQSSYAPVETKEADALKERLESTGKVVVFRSKFTPTEYQISYYHEGNGRFEPLMLLEFGVTTILGCSLVTGWLNWRRVINSAAGLRGSKLAAKTPAKRHARA